MGKHDLQIVIVDDTQGEKCSADCGMDWSSAEAVALASQQVEDRFGEEIPFCQTNRKGGNDGS